MKRKNKLICLIVGLANKDQLAWIRYESAPQDEITGRLFEYTVSERAWFESPQGFLGRIKLPLPEMVSRADNQKIPKRVVELLHLAPAINIKEKFDGWGIDYPTLQKEVLLQRGKKNEH